MQPASQPTLYELLEGLPTGGPGKSWAGNCIPIRVHQPHMAAFPSSSLSKSAVLMTWG